MELLRKITLIFRRYHYYQAALAELETYSDRQLSELGLRRGDIAGLAYEMAEQRVALHEPRVGDALEKRAGVVSKLVRWVRERVAEEIRYRRSLRVLRRLDERTLNDVGLDRADLSKAVRRHARAVV